MRTNFVLFFLFCCEISCLTKYSKLTLIFTKTDLIKGKTHLKYNVTRMDMVNMPKREQPLWNDQCWLKATHGFLIYINLFVIVDTTAIVGQIDKDFIE